MPTLREQLDSTLKDAMRAKDELTTNTVRAVKSAVKYKEVEGENKVLDDAGIIAVVTTLVKQRRDSITQYEAAKRQDLADAEKFEVEVLSAYMPQALTAAEIEAIVGPGGLSTDDADRAELGRDWTKVFTPDPLAIVRPRSTAEVSAVLRVCAAHATKVVPSGGRTAAMAARVMALSSPANSAMPPVTMSPTPPRARAA